MKNAAAGFALVMMTASGLGLAYLLLSLMACIPVTDTGQCVLEWHPTVAIVLALGTAFVLSGLVIAALLEQEGSC